MIRSRGQLLSIILLASVFCQPLFAQDVISDAFERKGNELYEKGQFAEAAKYLKQTLAERKKGTSADDTGLADVYVKLGNCALNTEDLSTATLMFNSAIKLQQDSREAANAYIGLAKCFSKKDRFADAENQLRKVIAISQVRDLSKENSIALQELGFIYLKQGRNEEGALLLKQAAAKLVEELDQSDKAYAEVLLSLCSAILNASPSDAQALVIRARCKKKIGNLELAIKDLDTAIVHDVKCTDAYIFRGIYRAETKDNVGAQEDLDVAESLSPKDVRIFVAKANAFSNDLKVEKAIFQLSKAIAQSPKDVRLIVERAKLELFYEKFADCIEDCNRAITLDSRCANAFAIRGLANYISRNNLDANWIEDLNVASRLEPQNRLLIYHRGMQEMRRQKYEDAVLLLTAAIASDACNANAYYQRSGAYLAMSKLPEAIADLDTAILIQPKVQFFYVVRGSIKLKLDDYSAAMSDFNTAASFRVPDEYLYILRAECLTKLNKPELAKVDLEAARTINPRNTKAQFLLDQLNGTKKPKDSVEKSNQWKKFDCPIRVTDFKTWWSQDALGFSPTVAVLVENQSEKDLSWILIQFQGQFSKGLVPPLQIARYELSETFPKKQKKVVRLKSPYKYALAIDRESPPPIDFKVLAKVLTSKDVDASTILTGSVTQVVLNDSIAIKELSKRVSQTPSEAMKAQKR